MRSFDRDTFDPHAKITVPHLIVLDDLGSDVFRNRYHQANVNQSLFGGQIVAQALAAADHTAPAGKSVHSLHAYFLRRGINALPVEYRVERLRDGRRFATRRVTAAQGGQLIFSLECSYRAAQAGFSHFRPTAIPFAPETALGGDELRVALAAIGHPSTVMFAGGYPVEVRIPELAGFAELADVPKRHYWLRAIGAEGIEDPAAHRQILAFLSDFLFVGVPLARHTVALPGPHLFVASLDHAIWFHRPVRCDDWLLFETAGPNAEGAVNLAWGHVYDRAGDLVASVAQEALQYPIDDAE